MSKFSENAPEWPILRLYELISGPADSDRSWEEIAALFLPGARLRVEQIHEDGTVRRGDWSVDEFTIEAAEHYRQNGFWEREIARNVVRFGNIAHVFSTYESRIGDPDSPPLIRGINSVQLLYRDDRWLIAGIVFHMEESTTPIPAEYLPAPGRTIPRPGGW
jgi:hypothetical protein